MASRFELISAEQKRLADETGTIFKNASLKVALCYPSPYHVGMSSLGFQTIYRAINSHADVCAERVFLPDDTAGYADAGLQPFSIESQTPIDRFSVLAFSVAYELEITGLFSLLEAAGISAFREQRNESAPLIVAGGPITFSNPEPLEPFVDVIVQGESDDLIHTIVDVVQSGGSRSHILSQLSKIQGFRVPGYSDATSRFFVAKALDENLPAYSQIVTPNTELRNMFLIEPERGCSRGCHYCVMRRTTNGGMRTVPVERVVSLIPEHARRVGLVGAAVTDHPRIVEVLAAIAASNRQVSVSSLRADRLTQEMVNALRAGGAQVLTVASDGPSQKLRDLIDRKHSEEQLLNAAHFAKTAGIGRLKVYNIVGLPHETEADIDELIRFTVELSKILPTSLGVAPFVAKRNTPLDGAPFAGIEEIEKRLEQLRKGLRGRAEVRPTSARWAWVEYMLAQCGPEAGLAAYEAWKEGGRFSAWKKAFEAQSCRPFEIRRVPDGRRNATAWPSVGQSPHSTISPTTIDSSEAMPTALVTEWGPLEQC